MNELKCQNCDQCEFEQSKGRPGRYFCRHRNNPNSVKGTSAYTRICKTERYSTDFTIKRTPKWCPKEQEQENENLC